MTANFNNCYCLTAISTPLIHWKVEARCVKYGPWRSFVQGYIQSRLVFTRVNSGERKRSSPRTESIFHPGTPS